MSFGRSIVDVNNSADADLSQFFKVFKNEKDIISSVIGNYWVFRHKLP
jgi:hypothetical protein